MARDNEWDLDGLRASTGAASMWTLPVPQFAAFVWWWATHDAEEKDRTKFKNKLWMPPVGDTSPIPANSPWSPEAENAALAAFSAQVGGPAARQGASMGGGSAGTPPSSAR
jgi:hypothetical protein